LPPAPGAWVVEAPSVRALVRAEGGGVVAARVAHAQRRKKVICRGGAGVMIGSPPALAAVTAFATHAKR